MKKLLKKADHMISRAHLRIFKERSSLVIFYLHGILSKKSEALLNVMNPFSHSGITIANFRMFVEYFLEHNYVFISPDDLIDGVKGNQKYLMITFDDGYYSNQLILPYLQEFKVPAVFFISTDNIFTGKSFWWDVLFRERLKSGVRWRKIVKEIGFLKTLPSKVIESYLIEKFGIESFSPICDIDRPFSVSELRKFSKDKYVHIGNHTKNHGILTNYGRDGVKSQILDAQNELMEITSRKPIAISYPSGKYSNYVVKASREIGLRLGMTIDAKKNYFPLSTDNYDSMTLGRFPLSGLDHSLTKQFEIARSDFTPLNSIKIKMRSNFPGCGFEP